METQRLCGSHGMPSEAPSNSYNHRGHHDISKNLPF